MALSTLCLFLGAYSWPLLPGQRAPDLLGELPHDAFGQGGVPGLDHQPDLRLGPARPDQAAPVAVWKPWFDITVTTTASPASRPASFISVASTVMIWSPSSGCPSASTARHRSASPS